MELWLVLTLVLAAFFVLLASEAPIGFCLALSGALGIGLTSGFDVATSSLAGSPFESVASYSLSIVPMYILVGMFALHSRIAEQVYQVADRVLHKVRGGLGVATVAACAGFAAVTGSSVATAASIGRISIDEMRSRGYSSGHSAGIVAAAGTLGILIPPSIILAIYGVLTRESIERLLTAGIVPGVLSAVVYATFIVIRGADRQRATAGVVSTSGSEGASLPPAPDTGSEEPLPSLLALPWRGVFRVGVLFAVIMLGVYTGIFTVTESGALGSFFALVIMVIELRKQGMRNLWQHLSTALQEVASTTSMAFFVLVGSTIFTFFLVSAGVPTSFTRWVTALDLPATAIIIVLLLTLIPLGMALDSLSVLIIFVPLTYPVITQLGFDGIWYAILLVKMIELGQITPPVGINVYVVAGVGRVRPEEAFRGIAPFALIDIATVALLLAVPGIVTWLPNLVLGPA